jgi:cysteinyl-tRNA synthetase
MKWDSPWGEGYPGWHIECSAMSMKYLTKVFEGDSPDFTKFETIDIHTGGEDNIFPHHDCEIAQVEGATGKKFSNFWLHNKHLLVDGAKMAKSSGTMYLLKDLLDMGLSREAIRMALMSTHYRQTINFSIEGVKSAQQNINRIQEVVDKLLDVTKKGDSIYQELSDRYRDKFRDAMNDDLNVSEALGVTFQFINQINKLIVTDELVWLDAGFFLNYFMDFNKIFEVLRLEKIVIPNAIIELAEERKQAKEEKDFETADQLRDEITSKGYTIKDNKDGSYSLKKN